MPPENRPFQKEMNELPTTDFQVICSFSGGVIQLFQAPILDYEKTVPALRGEVDGN